MSVPVLISAQAAKELAIVAGFFGIDMTCNSHIFRAAARPDAKAFERVIHEMSEAVMADQRFGATARIRAELKRKVMTS